MSGCQIMVPFWVPNIIRHLLFRVSKRDPNSDNYPNGFRAGVPLKLPPGMGFASLIRFLSLKDSFPHWPKAQGNKS